MLLADSSSSHRCEFTQPWNVGKTGKTESLKKYYSMLYFPRKTKCLCSLLDSQMVEESFAFLEDNRVAVKPERDEFSESVAEFMQRNKMKIDLPPLFQRPSNGSAGAPGSVAGVAGLGHGQQQQTPNTEFLSKELRTPEVQLNPHLCHITYI